MGAFDPTRYEPEKERAHQFFLNTKEIHSPLLGTIYFNSDGFMHLIFSDEEGREKRDWKDQIRRFQFLPKVPDVLKKMTHCQEYFEIMKSFEIKMNKQRMKTMKKICFWGFVAIINNYQRRIKIIVRQVGNGQIHFWSVIPYWNVKHYKDIEKIGLAEGDLAIE